MVRLHRWRRMIRLGFNHDHSTGGYRWSGMPGSVPVESFSDPAFAKAHPSPEGRFMNAQGQVSSMFSLHYPPYVEAADENLKKKVQEALAADDGSLGTWRISSEEGGWLDYSMWAVQDFRKWLKTSTAR